jgi:hypothetical protein
MELWGVRRRIASSSDVPDNLTARYRHPFVQPGCILTQVRVVVAVGPGAVEFVNRDSSLDAQEEFSNRAVCHSENRRAARPHDVDRLVTMPMMNLVE